MYVPGKTFTAETLTPDDLNAELLAISAAFSQYNVTPKKVRITHADLTEGSNGVSQGVTLFTIPAGSLVLNALTRVEDEFGGGAASSCTEQMGDNVDTDGLCKAHDVFGSGDNAWIQEGEDGTDKGAYLWNGSGRTHKFYSSATAIKVWLTPDGSHNLAAMISGSLLGFVVYMTLSTS